MNANQAFRKRNEYDIGRSISTFERKSTYASQIKYSEEIKTTKGHQPIKIGFTDFCVNPMDSYIPDLLHQPKKGVFADLLVALEQYLTEEQILDEIEQRMTVIPRFTSVERFGRSWFRLRTVTASNYTDMVRPNTNVDYSYLFNLF